MKFDLFDMGGNGEYKAVGWVEISGIFAMKDVFFNGAVPLDGDLGLNTWVFNLIPHLISLM